MIFYKCLLECKKTISTTEYSINATGFDPDYIIGFLRPDKVRGDACPVFTGSVAIAGKSDCLEILA
jgi:hypothetical protein